jgi:hypothetical protein
LGPEGFARGVDVLGTARAIVAVALLAYVPGALWVRVLLPELRGRVERFVVAVGVSVCALIVLAYVGNRLLGVPIAAATSLWWALLVCAGALAVPLSRTLAARIESRFP